jgi:hypothetical protein
MVVVVWHISPADRTALDPIDLLLYLGYNAAQQACSMPNSVSS